MNFRVQFEDDTGFNITPLIDVVFLLLFFFMTLSTLFQLEREMRVNVPAAESAESPARSVRQIVINLRIHRDDQGNVIDNQSEIWVNQMRLTPGQLADKLSVLSRMTIPRRVLIRADARAFHEDVMQVMDVCRKAGIEDYVLAAVEKETSPPPPTLE